LATAETASDARLEPGVRECGAEVAHPLVNGGPCHAEKSARLGRCMFNQRACELLIGDTQSIEDSANI
jgi:hypothetical protein